MDRKLDTLIAVEVMGLTREQANLGRLRHYSSDIAEAWKVLDKFQEAKLHVLAPDKYYCQLAGQGVSYWCITDSMPKSICRTALRMKGVEYDD